MDEVNETRELKFRILVLSADIIGHGCNYSEPISLEKQETGRVEKHRNVLKVADELYNWVTE